MSDHVCRPVFDADGNVIARAQVSPDITDDEMGMLGEIISAAQRWHAANLPADEDGSDTDDPADDDGPCIGLCAGCSPDCSLLGDDHGARDAGSYEGGANRG